MIKRNSLKIAFIILFSLSIAFSSSFLCSAEEFNLNLKKGLNFISIPVSLNSTLTRNVLSAIKGKYTNVWSYDKTSPADPWKHYHPGYVGFSDLLNIESGKNYWIEALENCALTLNGSPISAGSFSFTPGWNIISWPRLKSQPIKNALYPLTLGTDYSHVFRFDPQTQSFQEYGSNQFDTFKPGQSYYIHALKNCSTANLPLPKVTITGPTENSLFNTPNITVKGEVNNDNISVKVNGISAVVTGKTFLVNIPLNEEDNIIKAAASNQAGDTALNTVNVTLDTIPPGATMFDIISETVTNPSQIIGGYKEAWTSIRINGQEEVPNNSSSKWSHVTSLVEGENIFSVTVKDKAGNESAPAVLRLILDTTAPSQLIVNSVVSPTNQATQTLSGTKEAGTSIWINAKEVVERNADLAWRYEIALSEGYNVLSIISKDEDGNKSEAVSVIIERCAGTIIGPDGGEVSSLDGKAKLIIPKGALQAFKCIKITTVDKENLEESVSEDKAILKVVECKPSGLLFNKPVTMKYKLDEIEVPGTQVELGLYSTIDGKITFYGETSFVEADGHTVTFTMVHFSTYAAIKNLISAGGAPIGGGVQIPLPDMFTGSFSQAIPIAVPPARAGMQPKLALTYRSSNPNSWLGVGFSLNPGHIIRSTRLGPPSYDDQKDTFYFVSDGGTTELIHLKDNAYQAKIESSFTKFFKESNDSWKVVGKDGSILLFGQTSSSKETSPKGTFSWYVTKALDTNSNYIEYEYTKDQGKSYLKQINYTGNQARGVRPTNTVKFFLEDRTDVISSYISASRIATAKRLKEIEVKAGYQLVWRYKLEYDYSKDTNRSILRRIRQLASDSKELPVQSFKYQKLE